MGNARKTVGPYAVKPHEDNDLLFRIIDSENELAAIVGKMSFRLTPESCPEQLEHNKASARRFAACLNVCEGIDTDSIENQANLFDAEKDAVSKITAQRDAARTEADTWENRACREATRAVELEQQRDALLAALEHLTAVTTPDINGQIGAQEEHAAALYNAHVAITTVKAGAISKTEQEDDDFLLQMRDDQDRSDYLDSLEDQQ